MLNLPGLRIVAWCLLVSCALLASRPQPVAASCASGATRVLWTYPSDGDTDVPTDAVVLLIATGPVSGSRMATLNGTAVRAASEGLYPLAMLDPDTEYTFRLESPADVSPVPPATVIHFRTGSHAAADAGTPRVVSSSTSEETPAMSELCNAVYLAGECFDTPPYVSHALQLESSDTVAWQIESEAHSGGKLWPRECRPTLTLHSSASAPPVCFELRAVSASGARSEPERFCPKQNGQQSAAQQVDPSANPPASCSVTRAHSTRAAHFPGLALLGVALRLWLRRRARAHASPDNVASRACAATRTSS